MGSTLTINDELMFPSDFIKSPDLKGRDFKLTIASISKQELQLRGGGKKIRPVLTFKEATKKFVCNPTNAESIAAMHGPKAELWVGKQIVIYPTRCRFGREVVDCVRVREPKQSPAKSEARNEFDSLGGGDTSPIESDLGGESNIDGEPPEHEADDDQRPAEEQQPENAALFNESQIINWIVRRRPELMDLTDAEKWAKTFIKTGLSRKWEKLTAEERQLYLQVWEKPGGLKWPQE